VIPSRRRRKRVGVKRSLAQLRDGELGALHWLHLMKRMSELELRSPETSFLWISADAIANEPLSTLNLIAAHYCLDLCTSVDDVDAVMSRHSKHGQAFSPEVRALVHSRRVARFAGDLRAGQDMACRFLAAGELEARWAVAT